MKKRFVLSKVKNRQHNNHGCENGDSSLFCNGLYSGESHARGGEMALKVVYTRSVM